MPIGEKRKKGKLEKAGGIFVLTAAVVSSVLLTIAFAPPTSEKIQIYNSLFLFFAYLVILFMAWLPVPIYFKGSMEHWLAENNRPIAIGRFLDKVVLSVGFEILVLILAIQVQTWS